MNSPVGGGKHSSLNAMSQPPDISTITVVIPVFNQVSYTANCVESLNRAGIPDSQIVVVNNASTDGTAAYLASRPQILAIHNSENHSCAFAWNQALRLRRTRWTILLNNDVVLAPEAPRALLGFAETEQLDVVSPAMREGELDYDFLPHAEQFVRTLAPATRRGVVFAVCFMVHGRVFDALGLFDDDPKLWGYEDDEFFRRVRRGGFRLAVTGAAFLHHFGSVTQKDVRSRLSQPQKGLGDREYYRKKTGQTWPKRKWTQMKNNLRNKWWKTTEQLRYGHTLHEKQAGGRWRHY